MKVKRLLGLAGILIITLLMSGCWVKDADDYEGAFEARAVANKAMVSKMQDSGLINETEANSMNTLIDNIFSTYKNSNKAPDKSISWYIKYDDANWKTKATLHKDFPKRLKEQAKVTGTYITGVEVADAKTEKIEETKGLDVFTYDVYVLKAPDEEDSNSTVVPLDKLSQKVAEIKKDVDNADFGSLATYFKNTTKKLLNPKENLIAPTKFPGDNFVYSIPDSEMKVKGPKVDADTLGNDFVFYNDGIPVATMRISELNKKLIEQLISLEGVSTDKYIVDKKGKAVYLLEYPVQYLTSITDEDGDGVFESSFENSDIRVNILTGTVTNKEGKKLNQSEELIRINGTGNTGEIGQSSFAIYGEGQLDNVGYEKATVPYGRLVLRDYLELSYMPKIIDNEEWVTLGRMVRLTNFEGEKSTQIGCLIDKNGNMIDLAETADTEEEATEENEETKKSVGKPYVIYISDIMDKDTNNADEKVFKKLGTLEDISSQENNEETEEEDSGFVGDTETEKILPIKYVNKINPTTKFPGDIVGQSVSSEESAERMIFYGIASDISPFSSALYSKWINSSDIDNGSLLWWNQWLAENGFLNYSISPDMIHQFFMGNYEIEMQKEGFVILDLNTIAAISDGYEKEDKDNQVNNMRTLFVILGIILMAYSIVLLAAWSFDVNIITGPRLMAMITFGNWEAIQNSSDLPNIEQKSKHYMTFGDTLKGSITIMCIGLALTFVDIIFVINSLINIFGGAGEVIQRVIFRNK